MDKAVSILYCQSVSFDNFHLKIVHYSFIFYTEGSYYIIRIEVLLHFLITGLKPIKRRIILNIT